MNWNEAHMHLMALDLPADLRNLLATKAQKLREMQNLAGKKARLTETQHAELWYRLLAPLKHTLSNARVGHKLKSFDSAPERHTAFAEYITLLEKLLAGLQSIQMQELAKIADATDKPRTPAAIAAERGLPNRGQHWTDWVSAKTRERIESLFDAIPTQAKRPKPFAYRIPAALFRQTLEVLQRRTLNELDILRQEIQLLRDMPDPSGEQTLQLRKLENTEATIKTVLWYITYEMYNEPVPSTWHGVRVPPLQDNKDPRIWTDVEDTALRIKLGMARKPAKKTNRPRRYNK
jgi:hypothetical protein